MIDLTPLLETDGVPIVRERSATAAGGKPEPPPFPVAGVGLSKRRYPPARTARTYREDEDNIGDDFGFQDEEEDESHLRVRGDEDGETEQEAEAEMLELFETAATALSGVIRAMRRRRATSEIGD